ncbi:2'-5' RNA ligase family protein [Bacillus rhizoplanae]|uniref:2'-5' RNA ligase family protein n=1 Tax=Bacillus rhizoplanae TaxID=2880966 RepID=UPI003D1AFC06
MGRNESSEGMSRLYAVIVTFDEIFAAHIKKKWDELSDLSSYINNIEGLEPHITLADYKYLDVKIFKRELHQFAKCMSTIEIEFSHIGSFPVNGTVFYAPTITENLKQSHTNYHKYFSRFQDNADSYYVPDKWVPHCTVASRLTKIQLGQVFQHVYESFEVMRAVINRIKLIQVVYEDGMCVKCNTLADYRLEESL